MDPHLPDVDVVPAPESDAEYRLSCPLCEGVARTRADLQCHLEVSHRKSRVTAALLDRLDGERGRSERANPA